LDHNAGIRRVPFAVIIVAGDRKQARIDQSKNILNAEKLLSLFHHHPPSNPRAARLRDEKLPNPHRVFHHPPIDGHAGPRSWRSHEKVARRVSKGVPRQDPRSTNRAIARIEPRSGERLSVGLAAELPRYQ
jgi:hypothetical protein